MRCEHIGGVLLLGVALLAAGCAASSSSSGEDDLAQIHATLARQAEAWSRGDFHEFVAGYARNPERSTFVGGDGTLVRGRDALEARYRAKYHGRQGRLEFEILETRRIGNDAWLVFGTWRLERPPDHPHGPFTLVFERAKDGGFEIVHDHSSSAE